MPPRRRATPDTPSGPTIQEIVRAAKGNNTWEWLAEQTAEHPGETAPRMTAKRLEQLYRDGPGRIEPASVRILSQTTGYSEQQILDAYARAMDIEVDRQHRSRLEVLLPPGVDELTEAEVSAVVALIRAQLATPRPKRR